MVLDVFFVEELERVQVFVLVVLGVVQALFYAQSALSAFATSLLENDVVLPLVVLAGVR